MTDHDNNENAYENYTNYYNTNRHNINRHNINLNEIVVNNNNNNNYDQHHRQPQRRIANLQEMRQQMKLTMDTFIDHYNFYNVTRGNGLTQHQSDVARFQYLCAVGNIEHLRKWIDDYIRNHTTSQFHFMANQPTQIPYLGLNYNLYPIFTATLWNNDPELIRFLYSYGLQLNINDQFGHFPEEAIHHLNYFHPISHLFPNATSLFHQNNINDDFDPTHLIRDAADFQNVIREIRIIVGEIATPENWTPIHHQ